MKPLAKNWMSFAYNDLQVARQIVSNEELTAATAFHCQQCIEKAFKALLALHDQPIPRIHDLVTLHKRVNELSALPVDAHLLRQIDDTYTESRYPLSEMSVTEQSPSSEKAKAFLALAQEIYDTARQRVEA